MINAWTDRADLKVRLWRVALRAVEAASTCCVWLKKEGTGGGLGVREMKG